MQALHRSLLLVALLLCMSLAGCTSNDASSSASNSMTEEEKQLPEWNVGQNWLYTFITPQFGEDSARLVAVSYTHLTLPTSPQV